MIELSLFAHCWPKFFLEETFLQHALHLFQCSMMRTNCCTDEEEQCKGSNIFHWSLLSLMKFSEHRAKMTSKRRARRTCFFSLISMKIEKKSGVKGRRERIFLEKRLRPRTKRVMFLFSSFPSIFLFSSIFSLMQRAQRASFSPLPCVLLMFPGMKRVRHPHPSSSSSCRR